MNPADLLHHRLRNQHVAETPFTQPEQIVGCLAAMQAQDWTMAKWAIGLRLPDSTDAGIEKAFNEGQILRTHLLRPTWHFVTPADIRWLLHLTAPRVKAGNAFMYRRAELDAVLFNRSHDTLVKALEGGKYLSRPALQTALAAAGIHAEGQRLSYLMMQAELEGIVCSGPRQGKHFTYALLEERVPATRPLNRPEALAELSRRYFSTRSPATLSDFVWWSGLTMQDAKEGVASLPPPFVQKKIGEHLYVVLPRELPPPDPVQTTFLLPDYDEYGISYKNRRALFAQWSPAPAGNGTYEHVLVVEGIAAGAWKRSLKTKQTTVETTSFSTLDKARQEALDGAVARYVRFFTEGLRDESTYR